MIRSVKRMKRFEILATDGRIGAVDDFYFDDDRWAIRYVVVDTGRWLPGRRVLISPLSVSSTEWNEQRFVLSISRDQVRDSPDIDMHQPVSRRHEQDYLDYYGYPYYWDHRGSVGCPCDTDAADPGADCVAARQGSPGGTQGRRTRGHASTERLGGVRLRHSRARWR